MTMGDFDMRETAKRAREQAAAAAVEMAERAAQKASGLRESIANKAQDVTDGLALAAAGLRDASTARLRDSLQDFNAAIPVLRELGYSLTDVSMTVGIPPKIQAAFHSPHEVTEESVDRAIAQHADRKLTLFLVRALYQAWKLQTAVEIAGMKPRGVVVEIGLTPSVSIKFS